MNETNLLIEGHDVCRYLLLMFEYFGQHILKYMIFVSTFKLHNLNSRLSLSIPVILPNSFLIFHVIIQLRPIVY